MKKRYTISFAVAVLLGLASASGQVQNQAALSLHSDYSGNKG